MDQWEQLRQQCMSCRACGLADTRTNVVFGVGSPTAEVLLVGEAPGASEDQQGEPFVGAAGKLLDDMLAMIGLRRQEIYITNSVKCRPPKNRDPLNTEKDACAGFLRRQLELMQPKILVCLGRISAAEIIRPDFKITQEHGQFFEKNGMWMTASGAGASSAGTLSGTITGGTGVSSEAAGASSGSGTGSGTDSGVSGTDSGSAGDWGGSI